MRDLDDLIVTSLRKGADTDVDAQALLAGAVARGQTRVRRRRLSLGLGVAVVAAMTVAAMTAGPRLSAGVNDDDQRLALAAPSPVGVTRQRCQVRQGFQGLPTGRTSSAPIPASSRLGSSSCRRIGGEGAPRGLRVSATV